MRRFTGQPGYTAVVGWSWDELDGWLKTTKLAPGRKAVVTALLFEKGEGEELCARDFPFAAEGGEERWRWKARPESGVEASAARPASGARPESGTPASGGRHSPR